MKIAYLARRPIPSVHAHAVQIVKMCEAFGKLGHQVTLFADLGDGPPASIYDRYGVEKSFEVDVFPKRLKRFRKPRFVARLLRQPSIRQADLFFGRDITSLAAVALLGKPLIYEAHVMPRPGTFRWRMLSWLLGRSNFHHLVCVTSTLADLHRRHFPSLGEKPIIVAPNAAAEPSSGRLDFSWPERASAVQVGFVGRPFPGKGIELMVSAAGNLPDLDFHVVGAAREELGWLDGEFPPNLHFHGYQPHGALGTFYEKFDVAVAPYGAQVMNASGVESAAITSPLKLLEYMAAGLPTVVSDLPGVRDIVEQEDYALIVPPGDEPAFAAALRQLAANPALRRQMGETARRRYLERGTTEARARIVLGSLADPARAATA